MTHRVAQASPAALPASTVRVIRTPDGIELYFPPLRTPGVALTLGAFGIIATALAVIATVALASGALADTGSLLSAVLLAAFVVPFAFFGLACVALAAFMVSNALLVRIDAQTIATWRTLFGVTVQRGIIARSELAAIEPHIAARHQSPFSAEPIYQLVARDRARTQRLVVAESLKGEKVMNEVKALIEG